MAANTSTVDTVVSLCKRRGFVFPCGEIYGGTRSAWDYGPLGVELKENIKRQWWKSMVHAREDVVGLDSSIILPRETWVASGHVGTFSDPLVECLSCHKRLRADHLQEAAAAKKSGEVNPDDIPLAEIACPHCGNRGQWTEPRAFNMMLKTYLGVVDDESGLHYLRPETAQGIFINFKNVEQAARRKPPFGIAQVGKSFRNEITPGNFIFRTREFEQMEMEFFIKPPQYVKPGEKNDDQWHEEWVNARYSWWVTYGIPTERLRKRAQDKSDNCADGEGDGGQQEWRHCARRIGQQCEQRPHCNRQKSDQGGARHDSPRFAADALSPGVGCGHRERADHRADRCADWRIYAGFIKFGKRY